VTAASMGILACWMLSILCLKSYQSILIVNAYTTPCHSSRYSSSFMMIGKESQVLDYRISKLQLLAHSSQGTNRYKCQSTTGSLRNRDTWHKFLAFPNNYGTPQLDRRKRKVSECITVYEPYTNQI